MINNYIINKNAQSTGEHEIHLLYKCESNLPKPENQVDLGRHFSYFSAKNEAKQLGYTNVDGCFYCLNKYHTR